MLGNSSWNCSTERGCISPPLTSGRTSSARARHQSASRSRVASPSPLASSRSSPNSRTVSSIRKRGSPSAPSSWRSRLLSTSEAMPAKTSRCPSPDATASAASMVHPPGKTARRRKSVCSSGVRKIVTPGNRVAHRLLPGREGPRPARQQRQALLQPLEQRLGWQHLDEGGGQFNGQGQAIEPMSRSRPPPGRWRWSPRSRA